MKSFIFLILKNNLILYLFKSNLIIFFIHKLRKEEQKGGKKRKNTPKHYITLGELPPQCLRATRGANEGQVRATSGEAGPFLDKMITYIILSVK